MIKFFRKIRQNLLVEGKTWKYLKYAIGEIVLVVIGILIALQVNNWNQDRILKKQEQLLLEEINAEFKYNKIELESNLLRYGQARSSLSKIIALFPIDVQSVNLDSLAIFLDQTHFVGNFDYSNISVEKMRGAATSDIISNEELRNSLLQWDVILLDYLEAEKRAIDYFHERYAPILNNHIPRPYREGFKDPRAKLDFLSSLEFENLIKSREKRITNLFRPVEESESRNDILSLMDRIIKLSTID